MAGLLKNDAGSRITKSFKLGLFDGLVFLVPFAVVLFVAGFVFNIGKSIAEMSIYRLYRPPEEADIWLKLLVEGVVPILTVVVALIGVSLIGRAWRVKAIHYCYKVLARLISEVPVLGTVYNATSQLVKQILLGGDGKGNKLVWVYFKGLGVWQMAMVVKASGTKAVVFMPMALNITNGYALVVSTKLLRPCSATFTEMTEYYASGGMLTAENVLRDLPGLPDDPEATASEADELAMLRELESLNRPLE